MQGFGFRGLEALADNQLGGTAADIHHQPGAGVIGEAVRHAQVDQAGLLAARHHFDIVAQSVLGAGDKPGGVARHAQGVGAHHAHIAAGDAVNALGEAAQAIQGAGLGVFVEAVIGPQAGAQLHLFGQTFQDTHLALGLPGHHHVETVGPQIDGGQMFRLSQNLSP